MSQFIEVTLWDVDDDTTPKTQYINVDHIVRYGGNPRDPASVYLAPISVWLTGDTMLFVDESVSEIEDAIRKGGRSNNE